MAYSDSVFVVAIADNNVDIILWELQCIDTKLELAVKILNTRRVLILGISIISELNKELPAI